MWTFTTAMKATAQRMASADLEWVASAVDINRETGGNLAEVLENVTGTVRGRYRLRRQIKTLTAEGRMSVKVLTGLPIAIFVGRSLFDSSFRDVMFHGFGPLLLAYCAVSLTLGWLVVSDDPREGSLTMPILFGAFIAAAVLVGWFTITVKPSAAAGQPLRGSARRGQACRVRPAAARRQAAAVRADQPLNMESDLAQAGHPHGIDVPKLLGIQAVLIVILVLLSVFLGQPLFALLGSGGRVPRSPVLDLQPARQAPGGHQWRRCRTPSTS